MQSECSSALAGPPWTRLIKSWSGSEGRSLLCNTPPVSLSSRSSKRKLLISTEAELLMVQPAIEIKAGAVEAIRSQGVRLLAELFGWVQQDPRLEVHGNDGSNRHVLWSAAGCTRADNLHEQCSPNMYGAILLNLLDTVAEAKDAALAATAFDQLLIVPGG